MNNLQIIENQNQRVMLTSQLAEVYETESRTLTDNFNNNKSRYQEGKHYLALEGEEKRAFLNLTKISDGSKNAKTLYLWTEKGAMLHAKSLNTDKAWSVYEELVDTYFEVQQPAKQMTQNEIIAQMAQANVALENRVDKVENIVDNLLTINRTQQRTLQKIVSRRVFERVQLLKCFNEEKFKKHKADYFQEIYHDLKDRFGVPSYQVIKPADYDNAVNYVDNWIEPSDLRSKEV